MSAKQLTIVLAPHIWAEMRRKAIHESDSTNPDLTAVIQNIIKSYYEKRKKD